MCFQRAEGCAGWGGWGRLESSDLEGELRRMPCASRRKPVMIREDFRENTFTGKGGL